MMIHISGNVFNISFLLTPCWIGFTFRNSQICELFFLERGEKKVERGGKGEHKILGEAQEICLGERGELERLKDQEASGRLSCDIG